MKTKLKYFSLAIAALLMVGFASCSSDDEPTIGVEENGTKTVTIKISEEVVTRTVGKSQTEGKVTFTDGHLYFVSATEGIVQHFTIGTEATGGLNINVGDIKGDGVTVSGIPATAIKAYIVGNYPGTGTSLASSGLISRVTDHTLKVEDQNVFEYVNLYGTSNLTPKTVGSETEYETSIELAPTVARIELGKLTAHPLIRGFTVDGIFVDNFYSEANIDGTLNPINIVDHDNVTETDADGIFNKGSNNYPIGYNGPISDLLTHH